MKWAIASFVAIFGLAAAGCDDPTLGEAFDDVESAAPDDCRWYCNPAADCEWKNLGTVTGEMAEELLGDLKGECLIDCAYKVENGVFIYEAEWNEGTQSYTLTVKERLDGGIWLDYLECLNESELWVCEDVDENPDNEQWVYGIDDGNEANCTAYNACVVLLDINLEYEWNPQAQEGAGACQASGDEYLWGDW